MTTTLKALVAVWTIAALAAGPATARADRPCGHMSVRVSYGRPACVPTTYRTPAYSTYRTPAYSYTPAYPGDSYATQVVYSVPVAYSYSPAYPYTAPVPVVYSYSPAYPGDAYATQVVYPVPVVYSYTPAVYGYRPAYPSVYGRPAVYRAPAPIYRGHVPFSGHRVPFSGHRGGSPSIHGKR